MENMENEVPFAEVPTPEDPRGPLTEEKLDQAYRLNDLVSSGLVSQGEASRSKRVERLAAFPTTEEWDSLKPGQQAEWATADLLEVSIDGLRIEHATKDEDGRLKFDFRFEVPGHEPVPVQLKCVASRQHLKPEEVDRIVTQEREAERVWRRNNLNGVVLELPFNPQDVVERWERLRTVTHGEVKPDVRKRAADNAGAVVKSAILRLSHELAVNPNLRYAYDYLLERLEATKERVAAG